MEIKRATHKDIDIIMEIIDAAKAFLKSQGVNQWQTGYPDETCIERDIVEGKGFLFVKNEEKIGYACIDFGGEPAYAALDGEWGSDEPYVVVHRMAFSDRARGKGIAAEAFAQIEQMSRERGVYYFRVDTDADNKVMRHLLQKAGFQYRGKIWFDNSEKIAFDLMMGGD